MKEKEILKDTLRDAKPTTDKKPKKRYYKPKVKKDDDTLNHQIANGEKPYVSSKSFKLPKRVGSYCIGGGGKGFCIHLENKPNWLHRKCMKLFLGWDWSDYESK